MSRKDYNAVAAALSNIRAAIDIRESPNQSVEDNMITTAKLFGSQYTIETLADVFATDNSRFDRNRFLAACGLSK